MENYFTNIIRPNLHNLTEKELLKIIEERELDWYNCKYTRNDMVDKIFSLWSQEEIKNKNDNKPIECLICWDNLTNGNNLSFECGHKFHSNCIIKSIMISSIDKYIEFTNDIDKSTTNINFCCPQCNKIINICSYNKNN